MNPDFEVIAATDCRDGNCPTVWRSSSSGVVRVRGYHPSTGVETDVDIPAEAWAQLAPQLAAIVER